MVYNNIVERCREQNISIARLEHEAGIGNGTISRWKENSPTLTSLEKVAKYFGCTTGELLKEE